MYIVIDMAAVSAVCPEIRGLCSFGGLGIGPIVPSGISSRWVLVNWSFGLGSPAVHTGVGDIWVLGLELTGTLVS